MQVDFAVLQHGEYRATWWGMNDAIASLVRQHDPDRFLTALFAPADKRDALLTLYAFNHELARAREVASEPLMALIRLQWWREVVEGERKRHEVATPLTQALDSGALDRDCLLPLIEARETEAYGDFGSVAEWRDWLLAGAGGVAVAAGRTLGMTDADALRPYGAAYAVAGLLRTAGMTAARGTCLLPAELLRRHGVVPEGFVADPGGAAARAAMAEVAGIGRALLAEAGRVPRGAIAAALPGVLAKRDLARWPGVAPSPRLLGDRLAVMLAGLTGLGLPG